MTSVLSSFKLKRHNPSNRLLTLTDIEKILNDNGLNIKVNDLAVYQKAFVHRSYLKTSINDEQDPACVPLQDTCNETYEFLGDTILNSIVGTYLYERFPEQNEGFLTKTRTKMVRGTTLGELAKRLGFGQWLIISQHVESESGRDNLRILEDLFESFIAAIYLDNGSDIISSQWSTNYKDYLINKEIFNSMDPNLDITSFIKLARQVVTQADSVISARSNGYLLCQKFVMNTYEKFINIPRLIVFDDNYKDQLQSYFQKHFAMFPTCQLLKEEGKTNQRWHTVGVHDRCGFLIGTGKERKKTDAEQIASRNALIYLGAISQDYGNDFFR